MRTKTKVVLCFSLFLLWLPWALRAQPTSRVIPFTGVATTLLPGTPAQALTIQLWDAAAVGIELYCENQTLGVDLTGAISFDFGAGTAVTPPCASAPPGLNPADFPSGSSRFLDVVDAATGVSVLPSRIALNAVAFALSPGPQGPQGPKGDQGPVGPQGPPGVVQSVSPGDASISIVGGATANPTIAVAPNGITNFKVADGALSPAKIAGTAATLGPNIFTGDQNINGGVSAFNPTGFGVVGSSPVASTLGIGVQGQATATSGSTIGVRGVSFSPAGIGVSGETSNGIGVFGRGSTAGLFQGNVVVLGDQSVSGNLTMVNSTATAGNILKGGAPFIHNFGTNNTFFGVNAGNLTMTGTNNTASGFQALQSNTIGFNNTASGVNALQNNCSSSTPCSPGSNAGSFNTASGFQALQSNTTGFENIAIGANALFTNTTGGFNIASGVNALQNNNGIFNTAIGAFALSSDTTGVANTAIGESALRTNGTGTRNTAIGRGADVSVGNLDNATAIGANAVVNASNKIRLGNANVTVIEAQVGLTVVSDRNQKENFQPVDGEQVLRKIGGLSLTSWNYIGHDPKQFRHYGPVAQEFFAAFGHDGVGTVGTDTTINSGDMEGILMIAVQALEKRAEAQSKQVEALKAENADLQAQLSAMAERLKRLEPVGAGLKPAPTTGGVADRNYLDGRYVLKGAHEVGFEIAAFDPRKSLVIDPVLSYSTYLGGHPGNDFGRGIAVDSAGNAYVTTYTYSTDFPTSNPFQPTNHGFDDAFVAKIAP